MTRDVTRYLFVAKLIHDMKRQITGDVTRHVTFRFTFS